MSRVAFWARSAFVSSAAMYFPGQQTWGHNDAPGPAQETAGA